MSKQDMEHALKVFRYNDGTIQVIQKVMLTLHIVSKLEIERDQVWERESNIDSQNALLIQSKTQLCPLLPPVHTTKKNQQQSLFSPLLTHCRPCLFWYTPSVFNSSPVSLLTHTCLFWHHNHLFCCHYRLFTATSTAFWCNQCQFASTSVYFWFIYPIAALQRYPVNNSKPAADEVTTKFS